MKILEFETVTGAPVGIVSDKITAFLEKRTKGITRIFVVSDEEPFEVMGSYVEVKEKIEKC